MRHQKKRNRSVANRYYKNRQITAGGYNLSIATGGTVYLESPQGNRKLDTMFLAGALHVSLPNNEEVVITQNAQGDLEVKA